MAAMEATDTPDGDTLGGGFAAQAAQHCLSEVTLIAATRDPALRRAWC